MTQLDKTIWNWISLKGGTVSLGQTKSLPAVGQGRVWDFVFKPGANGSRDYTASARCLLALRLRSMAYRKAGYPQGLCAGAALADLASLMADSKPKSLSPPSPKGKTPHMASQRGLRCPRPRQSGQGDSYGEGVS